MAHIPGKDGVHPTPALPDIRHSPYLYHNQARNIVRLRLVQNPVLM
jgi:hypothetical protein